jgi:hypothetical protein
MIPQKLVDAILSSLKFHEFTHLMPFSGFLTEFPIKHTRIDDEEEDGEIEVEMNTCTHG